jgi:hypothetical protein
VHKSPHAKGSTHDYVFYNHSHPDLPEEVMVKLDLGYVGILRDYPKLKAVLPFKRKSLGRGGRGAVAEPLSEEQKAFNKVFASERVVSEHSNSRVKKFQIWVVSLGFVLKVMML